MSFDIATYLIACARDCLDEPPLFAPRRMVEAAALVAAEGQGDRALDLLGEGIAERRGSLLGMDREQLALWLDELLSALALDVRRRALEDHPPDPVDAGAIVDCFYEAYNSHDVEAALALYAPDAEHHEVAQGRRARGPQEIGSGLARLMESFPDAHWRQLRRVVSTEGVAVAYVLSGTLAAPMGPFRTAGRRLELEGLHLFELHEGRIASSADYWDASSFTRQMTAED